MVTAPQACLSLETVRVLIERFCRKGLEEGEHPSAQGRLMTKLHWAVGEDPSKIIKETHGKDLSSNERAK